jgi:hypothetical protein
MLLRPLQGTPQLREEQQQGSNASLCTWCEMMHVEMQVTLYFAVEYERL